MADNLRIGGGAGAVVGFMVGLLMRPSLPLMGQPPIVLAIGALLSPRDQIDRMYSHEFLSVLVVCVVGGTVAGLALSKLLSLSDSTSEKKLLRALVAKTLESSGNVEPSAERLADPYPPPPAKTSQPPPSLRAGADRTQAVSPPPRPAGAPRSAPPVESDKPRRSPPPAPAQRPAQAVEGKIRNSVYRRNPDGTCLIVEGRFAGKTFASFGEMRRTLR